MSQSLGYSWYEPKSSPLAYIANCLDPQKHLLSITEDGDVRITEKARNLFQKVFTHQIGSTKDKLVLKGLQRLIEDDVAAFDSIDTSILSAEHFFTHRGASDAETKNVHFPSIDKRDAYYQVALDFSNILKQVKVKVERYYRDRPLNADQELERVQRKLLVTTLDLKIKTIEEIGKENSPELTRKRFEQVDALYRESQESLKSLFGGFTARSVDDPRFRALAHHPQSTKKEASEHLASSQEHRLAEEILMEEERDASRPVSTQHVRAVSIKEESDPRVLNAAKKTVASTQKPPPPPPPPPLLSQSTTRSEEGKSSVARPNMANILAGGPGLSGLKKVPSGEINDRSELGAKPKEKGTSDASSSQGRPDMASILAGGSGIKGLRKVSKDEISDRSELGSKPKEKGTSDASSSQGRPDMASILAGGSGIKGLRKVSKNEISDRSDAGTKTKKKSAKSTSLNTHERPDIASLIKSGKGKSGLRKVKSEEIRDRSSPGSKPSTEDLGPLAAALANIRKHTVIEGKNESDEEAWSSDED